MFLFSRFFHSIPIHISRDIVWETMSQSLCRLHYASSPSLSRLVCVCVCVLACVFIYYFRPEDGGNMFLRTPCTYLPPAGLLTSDYRSLLSTN